MMEIPFIAPDLGAADVKKAAELVAGMRSSRTASAPAAGGSRSVISLRDSGPMQRPTVPPMLTTAPQDGQPSSLS